jgi:hypothetical protein
VDRGHRVLDRQRAELFALPIEECIGADHERARTQFTQGCEGRSEVAFIARMEDMEHHPEVVPRRLQFSR